MIDKSLVSRPIPLAVLLWAHYQRPLSAQVVADPDNVHSGLDKRTVKQTLPLDDAVQHVRKSFWIRIRPDHRGLVADPFFGPLIYSHIVPATDREAAIMQRLGLLLQIGGVLFSGRRRPLLNGHTIRLRRKRGNRLGNISDVVAEVLRIIARADLALDHIEQFRHQSQAVRYTVWFLVGNRSQHSLARCHYHGSSPRAGIIGCALQSSTIPMAWERSSMSIL